MNSLQARPLHAKPRISSIDMHLWDAGGGGPNQGPYIGRAGGIAAAANSGQRVTGIQSNAKSSSSLTPQSQTANTDLLATNLTPSAQIGANL